MSRRTITAGREDEQGLTPLKITESEPELVRVNCYNLSAEEWRHLEKLAHEVNARADE